jgi:hypothetical protein
MLRQQGRVQTERLPENFRNREYTGLVRRVRASGRGSQRRVMLQGEDVIGQCRRVLGAEVPDQQRLARIIIPVLAGRLAVGRELAREAAAGLAGGRGLCSQLMARPARN